MGPLDLPDVDYDLRGSVQQTDFSPVVLLATERSGSNLLRSILGAHPDITAPHPLETAYPWRKLATPEDLSATQRRRIVRDVLVNKAYSHHPLADPVDVEAVCDRIEAAPQKSFLTIQEALYATCADRDGATHWVTKDPSSWDYLEELRAYYDDLRIVYLVRDARDVVLSFQNSNVGRFHPYFSARRWQAEQSVGSDLLDGEMADSIELLRYEDLLQEPRSVVESVCGALGVEFTPEMLHYYDTDAAKRASRSAQALDNLSSPIRSDNFAKFRDQLSDHDVAITEAIAGDELERFGYELVTDAMRLDTLDLDREAFERADSRMARSETLRRWRESPVEMLRQQASRSFSIYMMLRYGLLA